MNLEDCLSKYIEDESPLRVRDRVAPGVGTLQRKAFAEELRGVDEAKRQITFVASTESVDRYGDIIRVNGWNLANYKKNPVFLWGHRSGDPPIGKTVSLSIENNPPALVHTVQFADAATYPFADQIYNLYRGGFLRAVSVGFKPLQQPNMIRDDQGNVTGCEFTSQELMELSAVPLPANTDAVMRAAVESGIVSEADAERVFKSAEPADEDDAEELESLLRQVPIEMFKLSLLRLEALITLQSITHGSKRGARSDEITTLEGLLRPARSITSPEDLDQALRGGK